MHCKSVKITPPYRRRVELPYCCVPAVLQMVFERRQMAVPEQEEIGYELSLIVPEEIAHRFRCVRTGPRSPSGWGTRVGLKKFSIQRYFDRHRLPLRIVRYLATEIVDLEIFLADHLEGGDDIVVCFDQWHLLGRGNTEHVALMQALHRGSVILVDPAEDSPDLYRVELARLAEALCGRTTGQLGLWVISSGCYSGDFG